MSKLDRRIFAYECLFEFMAAINDCGSFNRTKLVKYGTCVCLGYESYDYDSAEKYYDKFLKLVHDDDLYGFTEITNPISRIGHRSKKEYDETYGDPNLDGEEYEKMTYEPGYESS